MVIKDFLSIEIMENEEMIIRELSEFEKGSISELTPMLDEYLSYVANTGETLFPWAKLKPVLLHKLDKVMRQFQDDCPIESLPATPNVILHSYDAWRQQIVERLGNFNSAPFTIQRLCELATDPHKHYTRTDKFFRGIQKNVMVISSADRFKDVSSSSSSSVTSVAVRSDGHVLNGLAHDDDMDKENQAVLAPSYPWPEGGGGVSDGATSWIGVTSRTSVSVWPRHPTELEMEQENSSWPAGDATENGDSSSSDSSDSALSDMSNDSNHEAAADNFQQIPLPVTSGMVTASNVGKDSVQQPSNGSQKGTVTVSTNAALPDRLSTNVVSAPSGLQDATAGNVQNGAGHTEELQAVSLSVESVPLSGNSTSEHLIYAIAKSMEDNNQTSASLACSATAITIATNTAVISGETKATPASVENNNFSEHGDEGLSTVEGHAPTANSNDIISANINSDEAAILASSSTGNNDSGGDEADTDADSATTNGSCGTSVAADCSASTEIGGLAESQRECSKDSTGRSIEAAAEEVLDGNSTRYAAAIPAEESHSESCATDVTSGLPAAESASRQNQDSGTDNQEEIGGSEHEESGSDNLTLSFQVEENGQELDNESMPPSKRRKVDDECGTNKGK